MNNLFDEGDLSLTQLSSTYAQCSIWYDEGMDQRVATFDLLVREMPVNRNFLVYAGLEELVNYLINLRYTDDQINILLQGGLISEKFAKYLKTFKFSGDVHAMPEGTIFFPGEPVVRITAPIIEASLIETALFNIATSNILFITKAARVRHVCRNKQVALGMQRAHSFESGMKGLRGAYICGLPADVWPSFIKKYNLSPRTKYIINLQHFFIKSFPNEIIAFEKTIKYFPANAGLMIDTYDLKKGLANAIKVGLELKKEGHNLRFVTIDSGDLAKSSRLTRKELDKKGLQGVQIMVATNLNEYKIKKLLDQQAPIDCFIVATEYTSLVDSPKLEVIYKMAELRDGSNIQYTAKLTPGKESFPGRKQVFRQFRKNKFVKDIVGLEDENYETPLLKEVLHQGKLARPLPTLDEMREHFNEQFMAIPPRLLNIDSQEKYPAVISKKLLKLFSQVKRKHLG